MQYQFADCVLDVSQHSLLKAGTPVAVEPQVFDLLHLLVQNRDRLISRDEIIEAVWQGRIVSDATISARIAAARKAVGDDGKAQTIIQTVARRGLKFVADVQSDQPKETSPQPAQAPPRVRYTSNDKGQSLAYSVGGSGPKAVRSGFGMSDIQAEWDCAPERAKLEKIEDRCQLLRFDYVGYGQSAQPIDKVDFDDAAEDLRAAADAAGFDRFALYSESGGVNGALRFAAKYPERVTRLAILNGYVDGRLRRAERPAADPIRTLIKEGWQKPNSGFTIAYLLSYFPEGPLEMLQQYAELMQASCPPERVLLQRDAGNAVANGPLLPLIQCPTLIMHSRRDGIHPLSEAQKLAAGIPNAELVVLNMANHAPLYGQPIWDEYMSDFIGFLTAD